MKVLINGINGKMGQVLLNEINNTKNMEVVAGVSKTEAELNIPVYTDTKDIKEQVDIIIDFSTPEGALNILKFAKEKSIPIVIATTGLEEQQDKILDYSKFIPVFQSSNMSYEINLMCELVAKLATELTDSDIEIVETHHRNKVDAPSGTALMLANSINDAKKGVMEYTYDRHPVKQKRKDNEIGIHSVRGGTEVGKHSVMFFGDNESFEITHTVSSRSIFAKGSIKAAEFLIKQKNGFYNMKDLIKRGE